MFIPTLFGKKGSRLYPAFREVRAVQEGRCPSEWFATGCHNRTRRP